MHLINPTLALIAVATVITAAACGDRVATRDTASACGPGVAVDHGAICVYAGALDPSDVTCPEDLPYAYSGDGWVLCSDREDLDAAAIDAAVAEANADPSDPSDPGTPACLDEDADGVCADVDQDDRDASVGAAIPTDPGDPSDPTTPTDPGCVDHDLDGVCADVDGDDRDPTVGAGDPVDPWQGWGDCVDEDLDGSCAGMDLDDHEPALRDVGLWTAEDGRVYLVQCLFYETDDPAALTPEDCQAVDICHIDPALFASLPAEPEWVPVAAEVCADRPDGYLESEAEIAGVTYTCGASDDAEMCFFALTPCFDDAGAITACEAPCVDDDRDGICDG